MTKCQSCGKEIADNDTIYPYPIYDLDIKTKSVTNVKAHVFCWDCFISFAGAVNAAINARHNPKLCESCNLNKENKNEQAH